MLDCITREATATRVEDIIISLEERGYCFGPRQYKTIRRFDYVAPGRIPQKETVLLQQLKKSEEQVCDYLVQRAKTALNECRQIVKKGGQ